LFTIAAGITTIATGGAAAPILIPALMWTGVGVGAFGGLLKIGGGIHGRKAKEVFRRLEEAIKDDIEAHGAFQSKLQLLAIDTKFSEILRFEILVSTIISPAGNGLIAHETAVGTNQVSMLYFFLCRRGYKSLFLSIASFFKLVCYV